MVITSIIIMMMHVYWLIIAGCTCPCLLCKGDIEQQQARLTTSRQNSAVARLHSINILGHYHRRRPPAGSVRNDPYPTHKNKSGTAETRQKQNANLAAMAHRPLYICAWPIWPNNQKFKNPEMEKPCGPVRWYSHVKAKVVPQHRTVGCYRHRGTSCMQGAQQQNR